MSPRLQNGVDVSTTSASPGFPLPLADGNAVGCAGVGDPGGATGKGTRRFADGVPAALPVADASTEIVAEGADGAGFGDASPLLGVSVAAAIPSLGALEPCVHAGAAPVLAGEAPP